jgi:hypothetical protein
LPPSAPATGRPPLARGRTGGQKPKLAQQMYDETDEHGERRYTAAEIAAE